MFTAFVFQKLPPGARPRLPARPPSDMQVSCRCVLAAAHMGCLALITQAGVTLLFAAAMGKSSLQGLHPLGHAALSCSR
jgi:hypothetical protein